MVVFWVNVPPSPMLPEIIPNPLVTPEHRIFPSESDDNESHPARSAERIEPFTCNNESSVVVSKLS
jgi:hypothetical protein